MQLDCTIPSLPKPSPQHAWVVTPSVTPSALAKTALVWLLGWILVWRARFVSCLGKLIWRLLPWFKEA